MRLPVPRWKLLLVLLALGGVIGLPAGTAHADTVVLSPAVACGIATGVVGACDIPLVGENCADACQAARALVRFDVAAAIPAYSTIDSATLDLGPDVTLDIEAHELQSPWNENVDWETIDGVTPWSGPFDFLAGGADGDYDPTPGDITTILSRWVSGAAPNFGLLFKATEVGSEWNDLDEIAPTISVVFTPPDPTWVDGEPPSGDVGDVDATDAVVPHDDSNDPDVGEIVPDREDDPAELLPLAAARGPVGSTWKLDTDPEGGWVTVRNKFQQFYIGAGKDGWTFEASQDHDVYEGYLWGWLYGQYKYCGWINVNLLSSPNAHEPTHCLGDYEIKPSKIASIVNCDQCNGGTGVTIKRATTGYRNLRPWGGDPSHYDLKNAAIDYAPNARVAWRYVTPDNRYVAVSDSGVPSNANWVFIPRSAFNLSGETPGGPEEMCELSGRGSPRRATADGHGDWPSVCTIH